VLSSECCRGGFQTRPYSVLSAGSSAPFSRGVLPHISFPDTGVMIKSPKNRHDINWHPICFHNGTLVDLVMLRVGLDFEVWAEVGKPASREISRTIKRGCSQKTKEVTSDDGKEENSVD